MAHAPKRRWCPKCNATVEISTLLKTCVIHRNVKLIDVPKRQPQKRGESLTFADRLYGFEYVRGKLMLVKL